MLDNTAPRRVWASADEGFIVHARGPRLILAPRMMLLRFGVYGFLALVPLCLDAMPLSVRPYDAARVAQLMLASACALSLVWRSLDGTLNGELKRLHRGFLAAVFVLGLIAVFLAPRPDMAFREAALWLALTCIAWAVAAQKVSVLERMRAVIAASLLYGAVIVVVVAAAVVTKVPLEAADLVIGYDNHRFWNHVQTVSLPLLAAASGGPSLGRRWQQFARVALVISLAMLFATAGRATLLAIIVGLSVSWFLVPKEAATVSRALGSAALVAGVLVAGLAAVSPSRPDGLPTHEPSALNGSRLTSDSARYYLWGIALRNIEQSPWHGIGPMHFAHRFNDKAAHPHNLYLQIAAEWGIPMLVLLSAGAFVILLALLRRTKEERDPHRRFEGATLFMTWIAVAVDACFSGSLVAPVSQVWIAFLAGWTAAWLTVERTAPPLGRGLSTTALRIPLVAVTVLIAFALGGLWWSIAQEVSDLNAHLQSQIERFPPVHRLSPRFWIHGWF